MATDDIYILLPYILHTNLKYLLIIVPLFSDRFYLLGVVAEKICKMIGSKIISFFEYIDSEDTTWAYLGKCLYRGSLFVPQLIVCVKTADLLP